MSHQANPRFWKHYHSLPAHIQELADQCFSLLKKNSRHPSLHLKKVGIHWSARVGEHHRAVGVESPNGILWHWIGTHEEYNRLRM